MDDVTWDELFGGVLRIKQKKKGYRYSIDPVLLCHFITPGPYDRIIDLGTGSGIIPVVLSHRYPGTTITGVEIQKSLADIALQNTEINGLEKKIRIICDDMRNIVDTCEPADLVVSNPPYMKSGSGRLNPDHEKAIARHEITITLPDLIRTAEAILKPSGRLALILPWERISDLERVLECYGLSLARIRRVHPFTDSPPIRVLAESAKNSPTGLTEEPPLVIYTAKGI
jgi:tRNA1Val (adenine37-N6)-methyltransferase